MLGVDTECDSSLDMSAAGGLKQQQLGRLSGGSTEHLYDSALGSRGQAAQTSGARLRRAPETAREESGERAVV